MARSAHEALVRRLALLLLRLSRGEPLETAALARELGVDARTLQRDLRERLSFLPLAREGRRWRLQAAHAGRLSTRDIGQLAALAAVRGALQADDLLRELFAARVQGAFLAAGGAAAPGPVPPEAVPHPLAAALEGAIVAHRRIAFTLHKDAGPQAYAGVEPYRLLRHKGAWYLAARDAGQFKTFSLQRMAALQVGPEGFEPDAATERAVADDDALWQARERIVLAVSAQAAPHLRQQPLLHTQVIEHEGEDGSMVVSLQAVHASRLLPLVRWWLPHLRILAPEAWQAELEQALQDYLADAEGRGGAAAEACVEGATQGPDDGARG